MDPNSNMFRGVTDVIKDMLLDPLVVSVYVDLRSIPSIYHPVHHIPVRYNLLEMGTSIKLIPKII